MLIAAVADMHGNLEPVHWVIEKHHPDVLLSCGDWGDPHEVNAEDFTPILERAYTLTLFGNHDHLELLPQLKNQDGSPILLRNGEIRETHGLRITGISGIWAKSHRMPYYVTDEEVLGIAESLKGKTIDVFLTHGCPVGLADLTPTNTHGGQRCFLEAFKLIRPRLYLCGHLHRGSSRQLKDGGLIVNVGYTRQGDYALFRIEPGKIAYEARRVE